MSPARPESAAAETAALGPASADLLTGPGRLVRAATATQVALVFAFVGWAYAATLEEVSVGQGKIIPTGNIQVVQNLEGGLVKDIRVRQGARVEAGDLLLSIEPVAIEATLGERQEKRVGLAAALVRLQAETEGQTPAFPPELLAANAALVAQQQALFASRRQELNAALGGLDAQASQRRNEIEEARVKIDGLEKALVLAEEERALLAPLVARGSVGRMELIRIDGRLNDIRAGLAGARAALPRLSDALEETLRRRSEKELNWRSEALAQLNEQRVQLAALDQALRGEVDKRERTEVRAPVAGMIKTVHVNTRGQVVKPGMDLVEIVPADKTLLIEARFRPQDIAFLRPDQEAVVKLTAYDYAIYGALKGKVERIGVDSITDPKGETYYPVEIRTAGDTLDYKGKALPIIPGMVAEVNVLTGHKSVMQYLTKPLVRTGAQALHER